MRSCNADFQIWRQTAMCELLSHFYISCEQSIWKGGLPSSIWFPDWKLHVVEISIRFPPKHSTVTALIQMCDEWLENMDNGKLNGIVFLDIKKASVSKNHGILLTKMKKRFGISNIELKWFESYLSNREQQCSINEQLSSKKTITCGVPQGSILSPLLFLLYINDLPECLRSTTPCMYADDTQIFSSSYLRAVWRNFSDISHGADAKYNTKTEHCGPVVISCSLSCLILSSTPCES